MPRLSVKRDRLERAAQQLNNQAVKSAAHFCDSSKRHQNGWRFLRLHMDTETTFVLDNFVATKPGEPYRLLPFGTIKKNGKVRQMTPELAAKFSLPPFKPPIKLGSHEEATPAGGHMLKLEVRSDGLWVYPELTDKGGKAAAEGDYRYHSPEVIWEDGGLVTNEGVIHGPLIVGDAWLHSPYLGESTAFYTTEKVQEDTQMNENVTIPQSLWDKFIAPLFAKEPEVKTVEVVKEPEDYAAVKQENEQYKVQLAAQQEAARAREERAALVAELQDKEKFGSNFVELKSAEEAAGMMAGMSPEQREWCMRNFRAFIAQIKESNLTGELGSEGAESTSGDPKLDFNKIVTNLADEKGIDYNAAFEQVKRTQPDLFKAAFPIKK